MTTTGEVNSAFTRVGTEFKDIRNEVFGSPTGDASGLDTTATNLVDAINEIFAGMGDGATWGSITGDITDQTDLVAVLADKADLVAGKVPSNQLPSFVDDVVEAANFASLPGTGETSKIYVTLDDNKTYRWGGSSYAQLDAGLALGETSSTAYRGDRGKTAYDHSQASGNPHGTTVADISGLQGQIDAKAPLASPALTGTPTAPTASGSTSTTQIATTAQVQAAITARAASTTAAGIAETATDAEAQAGLDTSRYLTSANLRSVLGDQTTDFVATFEAALV